MSVKRIIVGLAAGGAAIGAIYLVRTLEAAPQAAAELVPVVIAEPKDEIMVLTAARDMRPGEKVRPGDVEWRTFPKKGLSPRFLTEQANPEALTRFVGHYVREPVWASEPITGLKFADVNKPGGFMAAKLTPGMRAIAVPISVESASGGFILPDDHVDVVLSYTMRREGGGKGGGAGDTVTETVLQDVRVLAIDQTIKEVEGQVVVVGSTATLELTPRDAERLEQANSMGSITLLLRSLRDRSPIYTASSRSTGMALQPTGNAGAIAIYRDGKLSQTFVE